MAVRRKQYAKELEKAMARGKSTKVARKIAGRLSSTTDPLGEPDNYAKPSLVDKAILKTLRRKKAKK